MTPDDTAAPEPADAAAPDSPDTSAPQEGLAQTDSPAAGEPTVDWEKRARDNQAEFTRASQELSQYRQFYESLTNPDTQQQALSALGLELEAEAQQQVEYEDPVDELRGQIAQLEQHLQGQQQQAQLDQANEQLAEHISDGVEAIEQQLGRPFSQEELAFLVARAQVQPGADGLPDVAAAWGDLERAYQAQQQRWIESKKAPQAPGGQSAGKQQFDKSTRTGRLDAAMASYQALQDDS